jgi:RHH-type proline utilization regulon transcriptional repressor/proline dehydrogenase/delta 1-pyrroline-5-carboxylate dehydrogenase
MKGHPDACYLLCAEKMLMAEDEIFPQFATHNAHTLAAIYTLAKSLNVREFEFQRLHGMGESLYENFFKLSENHRIPCRVYAPVGVYRDLLPYLVRRLLENGANTSFVNHIYDTSKPIESLTLNPIEECRKTNGAHHPQVPPPGYLFAPDRLNSPGIDVSDLPVLKALQTSIDSLPREDRPTPRQTDNVLDSIIKRAHSFQDKWAQTPVTVRAQSLERLGKLMTDNFAKLLQLLVTEGKKTIPDAISEIREAIDFCHYYGHEAVKLMQEGHPLPGPTGVQRR